jgi:hypothetical protein
VAEGFLGAVVGAVLTIVAQWFLGPHIERRVRAVERWEGFVIEFAVLLEGPIKQAQDAARGSWMRWHNLYQMTTERTGSDPDHMKKMHDEDRAAFREALNAWGESLARARWLERQIVGDYRLAADDLRMLATRFSVYRFGQLRWDPWTDPPEQDGGDWAKVSASHKELLDEVEKVTGRVGVPVGVVQRVRAKRRHRREVKSAANRGAVERTQGSTPPDSKA